jgi:hypothetical protein
MCVLTGRTSGRIACLAPQKEQNTPTRFNLHGNSCADPYRTTRTVYVIYFATISQSLSTLSTFRFAFHFLH